MISKSPYRIDLASWGGGVVVGCDGVGVDVEGEGVETGRDGVGVNVGERDAGVKGEGRGAGAATVAVAVGGEIGEGGIPAGLHAASSTARPNDTLKGQRNMRLIFFSFPCVMD